MGDRVDYQNYYRSDRLRRKEDEMWDDFEKKFNKAGRKIFNRGVIVGVGLCIGGMFLLDKSVIERAIGAVELLECPDKIGIDLVSKYKFSFLKDHSIGVALSKEDAKIFANNILDLVTTEQKE